MGTWTDVYVAVGHLLLCATPPASPLHAAVSWDMRQVAAGAWSRGALRPALAAHGASMVLVSFAGLYGLGYPLAASMVTPCVCLALLHLAAALGAAAQAARSYCAADRGASQAPAAAEEKVAEPRERALAALDEGQRAEPREHALAAPQDTGRQLAEDMVGGTELLLLLCVVAGAAHEELVAPAAVRARYRRWMAGAAGALQAGPK
jgi:small-conductance mechanosensitive channel